MAEEDVYFEPKDKTDVQIKLSVEGSQKIFHVHALVLKMASPVFSEMLTKSSEIEITDIDQDDFEKFEIMLKYLYPGNKIDVLNEVGGFSRERHVTKFLELVEKYQIKKIINRFDTYLATPDGLLTYGEFRTMELAHTYNLKSAKEYATKHFANDSTCIAMHKWSIIDLETRMFIIRGLKKQYKKAINKRLSVPRRRRNSDDDDEDKKKKPVHKIHEEILELSSTFCSRISALAVTEDSKQYLFD